MIAILEFWGHVRHRWKGIFKTYLLLVHQEKNQVCSHITSANQGGQKNRNEQTTVVLLYNVFYYCEYIGPPNCVFFIESGVVKKI
jgi:hypothetical protein